MKVRRRRFPFPVDPSGFVVAAGACVLVLSGCGGGSSGSDSTYTLSSGTYQVSGSSAESPDQCNLADDVRNGDTVQIAVSGNNATFSFDTAPDPNRDPVLTIQGNTLNAGSKTYDKDHHAEDPSFDCVETITVTLSGRITGQNKLQGTIGVRSTPKSGRQCTPDNLQYKTHPCSSTLNFTATKI